MPSAGSGFDPQQLCADGQRAHWISELAEIIGIVLRCLAGRMLHPASGQGYRKMRPGAGVSRDKSTSFLIYINSFPTTPGPVCAKHISGPTSPTGKYGET